MTNQNWQPVYPMAVVEHTAQFVLAAVKVLLAHDVAPVAILAMVERMEAIDAEAAQTARERFEMSEKLAAQFGSFLKD